jgi:hypothetical protein
LTIPTLEGIHNKVLQSVSNENSLEMTHWHTCDTTHCWAGWIVFLSGKEGKELEEKTSTLFAAMQIWKASSSIPVNPTLFFKSNEVAMEEIKRHAELETLNK